jgi:hypothetical protein
MFFVNECVSVCVCGGFVAHMFFIMWNQCFNEKKGDWRRIPNVLLLLIVVTNTGATCHNAQNMRFFFHY